MMSSAQLFQKFVENILQERIINATKDMKIKEAKAYIEGFADATELAKLYMTEVIDVSIKKQMQFYREMIDNLKRETE